MPLLSMAGTPARNCVPPWINVLWRVSSPHRTPAVQSRQHMTQNFLPKDRRASRTLSWLALDLNAATWPALRLFRSKSVKKCKQGLPHCHWGDNYRKTGNVLLKKRTLKKKRKQPKLPCASLKVTSKCFIFRSSTNKKLIQGKSAETRI